MKINLQVYLSIYEILNWPIYLHTLYIWFYDFNIYIVSKINFYVFLLSLTSLYLSVAREHAGLADQAGTDGA